MDFLESEAGANVIGDPHPSDADDFFDESDEYENKLVSRHFFFFQVRRRNSGFRRLLADVRKRSELKIIMGHADGTTAGLSTPAWGIFPAGYDLTNWLPPPTQHASQIPEAVVVGMYADSSPTETKFCYRCVPNLQVGDGCNWDDPDNITATTGYRVGCRIQVREMRFRCILQIFGQDTEVVCMFLKKRVGTTGDPTEDYQCPYAQEFVSDTDYPDTCFQKRDIKAKKANIRILQYKKFSLRGGKLLKGYDGTDPVTVSRRVKVSLGKTFKPGYRPNIRLTKVKDYEAGVNLDTYRPSTWEYYFFIFANHDDNQTGWTDHYVTISQCMGKFTYYDS